MHFPDVARGVNIGKKGPEGGEYDIGRQKI
jgi:hypothetical protein